jgi:hypothetical protein
MPLKSAFEPIMPALPLAADIPNKPGKVSSLPNGDIMRYSGVLPVKAI